MNERPNHFFSRFFAFATAIPIGLLVLGGLPLLMAFEAHVVNVTAKIEPRPPKCDAVSLYYWKNHEGCKKGKGESEHASEVQTLSSYHGGALGDISGGKICKLLAEDHCSGTSTERARCDAKKHTLVIYLNLATLRLDPTALLAGADDGSQAFDRLHLSAYSPISDALIAIEAVLKDEDAKKKALEDAARVAERITTFYEGDENPFAPKCIFDPKDVPQCIDHSFKIRIHNENHAVIENDVDIEVNTGGNSANSGDGGTIVTGGATVNVHIENTVNTDETTINTNCSDCTTISTSHEREVRQEREAR
jgi:hypothetical protein